MRHAIGACLRLAVTMIVLFTSFLPTAFGGEPQGDDLTDRIAMVRTLLLESSAARRVAAIRYSGRWTEARYLRFKEQLEAWLKKEGLEPDGTAVWARYDDPFTLWFMRRNEVLIPIADSE